MNVPDLDHAARFLTLLDEEREVWTFQTFDDNADRKDPALTHIFISTPEDACDRLVELNQAGAGIFVTCNRTDDQGRQLPVNKLTVRH